MCQSPLDFGFSAPFKTHEISLAVILRPSAVRSESLARMLYIQYLLYILKSPLTTHNDGLSLLMLISFNHFNNTLDTTDTIILTSKHYHNISFVIIAMCLCL